MLLMGLPYVNQPEYVIKCWFNDLCMVFVYAQLIIWGSLTNLLRSPGGLKNGLTWAPSSCKSKSTSLDDNTSFCFKLGEPHSFLAPSLSPKFNFDL